MHGPEFPAVVAGLAALPDDHPLKIEAARQAAAAEAAANERAALRAAAAAGRAQAGLGSPVERLAALEARVAALEANA